MVKNHLKRIATPQTWAIHRKKTKFVVRPRGYLNTGMPVAIILRELLDLASSRKEIRSIIQNRKIVVDGRLVKDERLSLILMSVIKITDVESYRLLLNKRGKLYLKKLSGQQATVKPCKVITKSILKGGKIQLGFHDGNALLTDNKEINVNDTVIFKLPEMKIEKHLKLEKGSRVYITEGSNVGSVGVVENLADKVAVKINDHIAETGKHSVFAIDGIDVNGK